MGKAKAFETLRKTKKINKFNTMKKLIITKENQGLWEKQRLYSLWNIKKNKKISKFNTVEKI